MCTKDESFLMFRARNFEFPKDSFRMILPGAIVLLFELCFDALVYGKYS